MRRRWRFARTERVHWPSAAVAFVGTGLLFASAFAVMTRVSTLRFATRRVTDLAAQGDIKGAAAWALILERIKVVTMPPGE